MKLFSLKSYKILVSLIVLIVLSVVLNNFVLAEFNVKQFDGKLDNPEIEKTKIAVSELLLDAVTAVRIVGLAIAIIILIVIGMKIMLAAPSEKANWSFYTNCCYRNFDNNTKSRINRISEMNHKRRFP